VVFSIGLEDAGDDFLDDVAATRIVEDFWFRVVA
jgi:hypothetical protein